MKKRRILLPIFLLSAFVLGGCTTNKKQESSQDTTQYGVEIANKAVLEGEWYVGENKDLDINLTPEANPLTELGKNLTITSSDTSVVAVTGLGLTGLKVGTAKVTVDYHGVKAEVNANIQSADPRDKYGTTHEGTAADPFDNEDALLAAKSSKYNGEDFYVKGIISSFYHAPGARDDGYVSWFLTPAEGKTEKFEIYKCKKQVGTKTENLTDDDVWVGGLATAHGKFTSYNGQYETSEAVFVSCEGDKPDPRQTIEKTFAEMLTANAALADGADTYDYFRFDAYVTKKSGTNYFLTATKGEELHEVDYDETHKYYDNAFEIYNAVADGLADKLLKDAKVKVTSIVKNYHGQAENLLALAADDVEVLIPGEDWDAPAPADKYYSIETPVVGTKYRWGIMTQAGREMFSTGKLAGYNGEVIGAYADAAEFEIVGTTGGYHLKATLADSSVKYVNGVVSGDYTNLKFEDTPATVYTFDNTYMTLTFDTTGHTTPAKDVKTFFGTFNANQDIRCSAYSYLSASNYDVSQFPAHFFLEKDRPAATGITLDPSDDFELEVGKSQTIVATIQPAHAAGEIEWAISPNDAKVTVEDGVVTVANDAVVGTVVTVTASVKDTEFTASVKVTVKAAQAGEVTDVLTITTFGATGTSYAEYDSNDSVAGTYHAQCAAGNDSIQIRSKNSNSGVIGTNGTKTCKSITITFNSNTQAGNTVDIYAANEAFAITSMYGGTMTKVGSLSYGDDATVTYTFTADYSHIGLRSNNGAIYMSSVTVIWK